MASSDGRKHQVWALNKDGVADLDAAPETRPLSSPPARYPSIDDGAPVPDSRPDWHCSSIPALPSLAYAIKTEVPQTQPSKVGKFRSGETRFVRATRQTESGLEKRCSNAAGLNSEV